MDLSKFLNLIKLLDQFSLFKKSALLTLVCFGSFGTYLLLLALYYSLFSESIWISTASHILSCSTTSLPVVFILFSNAPLSLVFFHQNNFVRDGCAHL